MWALLRPPFKALGIGQHTTRTLAVSFVTLSTGFCVVQTGTTPESERRPEALGKVYNTRTFVHVHRGMDQVGGEKLEVGTAQRIRIRRRRSLATLIFQSQKGTPNP
ncbi:hypothetical protein Bca101_001870 [Brassica carinata]